ncbi:E3 ubiquitin-protein ligase ATL6-like [Arachis stenosperma]|uniref:E3 ubiquitin-protein ligase ATL6-like n=1 Tax=Arachis stenosperma TaxID=217475 RepID=UPI0025AD7305|nr:E3 ubiquitin-protein ligase ATL6-like [Arachis stenosperma]
MTSVLHNCPNDRIILLSSFLFHLLLFFPFIGAQSDNNNQNNSYYNRFSPSMAIIVVILVSALFLMGFFSIYIRHCSDSPSVSIRHLVATGRSRRGPRGLDPAVIHSFPTLEYSVVKIHKIGKGALECAVCLNEFEDTETLRLIPKCDHVFHPECIDEWLESHTTCPVCRADLLPQPGDSVRGAAAVVISELANDQLSSPRNLESRNQSDVVVAVEQESENLESNKNERVSVDDREVLCLNMNQALNLNRTRGSRSGRPRRFPRSHSTGHSLVQPGEDTERFTLRLPLDVRKKILEPQLNRARSLVILPREGSSKRGYRTGGGEGSSRGRSTRRLDRVFKSDRWIFTMAPPFLVRASSMKSPRVANSAAGGSSSAAPAAAPPVLTAPSATSEIHHLPV